MTQRSYLAFDSRLIPSCGIMHEYEPQKFAGAMLEASSGVATERELLMQPHNTREPYFPQNLDDYAPWVAVHGLLAPYGECQCGCGEDAPLASRTMRRRGWEIEKPIRFSHGHNPRGIRTPLEVRFWRNVDKRGSDECWE